MAEKQTIDFEKSLAELETIVNKMENDQPKLEEALSAFEKGICLVKKCQKKLKDAEQTVDKLVGSC